jgi:predicted peptidase
MGVSGVRTLIRVFACAGVLAMTTLSSGCKTVPADPAAGKFVERSVIVEGAAYRYRVFVPALHAREADAPTILFLHGTGERGSDGEKPTRVGIGPYLRRHADTFPAIVVFPQAPDDSDWKGTAAAIAFAALDAATEEFGGDRDRTYLTGLSMGGYGTWELALMQPQRFAALVPVCGGLTAPREARDLTVTPLRDEADPPAALAQRLKHLPVWIFHGAKDDVVPPLEDRLIEAAFRAVGGDVRYTEFPEANHNSWDPAYSQTPDLWPWLFSQRRR